MGTSPPSWQTNILYWISSKFNSYTCIFYYKAAQLRYIIKNYIIQVPEIILKCKFFKSIPPPCIEPNIFHCKLCSLYAWYIIFTNYFKVSWHLTHDHSYFCLFNVHTSPCDHSRSLVLPEHFQWKSCQAHQIPKYGSSYY